MHYTAKDVERLWSRIAIAGDNDCWLWMAGCDDSGYGTIGVIKKKYKAHRMVYHVTYGALRDDLNVLHTCDTPRCCNPAHLFLGTQADNVQDMVRKNRQPKGEQSGKHKLTWAQVREIRARHSQGIVGTRTLAKEYGLNRSSIMAIIHRTAWIEPQIDTPINS